ncbi:MAG: type I-E CRISPR-associated endoribonuclease Cas2 [Chloroflexi bacterium]|nr:type I-E CRISPR-associated endoribonuclease Cas2 [Chloroflexota bacterium]
MVIFVLQNVPTSLRGELSRWMLEPRAGVFVGKPSAMVRDRLWSMVKQKSREGGCLLIHSTDNEQGFRMEAHGDTSRSVRDFEGLTLVQIP